MGLLNRFYKRSVAPKHNYLSYLTNFITEHKYKFLVVCLLTAFSTLIALLYPLAFGQVVTEFSLASRDSTLPKLEDIIKITLALFAVRNLVRIGQSHLLTVLGEQVVYKMRVLLLRHSLSLSMDFFTNKRTGDLVSRIIQDTNYIRNLTTVIPIQFISSLLSVTGAIFVALNISAKLTLLTMGVALIVTLLSATTGRRFKKFSRQIQELNANTMISLLETFQDLRVVKGFTQEELEISKYEAAASKAMNRSIQVSLSRTLQSNLIGFFGFVITIVAMWLLIQEFIQTNMPIGNLTAFALYGLTVTSNLNGLSTVFTQHREAVGALDDVFDILNTIPTVFNKPTARSVHHIQGKILFDNVSFSYDGKGDQLTNVDLEIMPGETIAIIGPSGAGKSTLVNLIPRFYDPSAGQIFIDKYCLKDIQINNLRKQIGIVPQEAFLFGGSILENIAYGATNATEHQIIEASKLANAHEFILSLPQQYTTVVGDRGLKLSGGQRQRIAIARAILRNPQILIFDEATNSLDAESDELIQLSLERIMKGRTVIIVTHRLNSIKLANRIIVINDGKIVESGTRENLIHNAGVYSKLHNLHLNNLT